MTRNNTLDTVVYYLFRYVWAICAAILVLEFAFMVHTASVNLRNTAWNIADASLRELEHKLSVTWKLGDALARDVALSDSSVSLEQRALFLKPYNDVYELFLIGITDEKGKITSTFDDIPGDIGHRDYFKRVVSTGRAEITDAFAAGANGVTKNYTICVPYQDGEGATRGTIIMSIPFEGINEMITRTLPGDDYLFTLLGANNTVMAERESALLDKPFRELVGGSTWTFGDDQAIIKDVEGLKRGSYWTLDNGRLLLVIYAPVAPTQWKLLTAVDAISSSMPVFAAFMTKAVLYLLLFSGISFFGRRYTESKLGDLNALVRQVVDLQSELQSKKLLIGNGFKEFMEVSQKGLMDELTDLPTRTVFLRQLDTSMNLSDINQNAALLIIDLDDLKLFNDQYGHDAGDCALRTIGSGLKIIADEYGALVSRFGGDEFLVYMPLADAHSLPQRLERLKEALNVHFVCREHQLQTHISIGASIHPVHGVNFETLYRKADQALYQSKSAGKNCWHIWNSSTPVLKDSSGQDETSVAGRT